MECDSCKKLYSSVSSLNYHKKTNRSCMKVQNGEVTTSFVCTFCDKSLCSKYRLDNHILVCKNKKKQEENENDNLLNTLQKKVNKLEFELDKKDKQIYELQEKVNRLESLFTNAQLQSLTIPPTQPSTSPPQSIPTQPSPPPAQPHKKARIPKAIKTMVWNSYIGSSVAESTCMCCKQERITIREFQCGHVLAESNGGELNIANLRPICHPCNMSMGTQHMGEFVKTFFGRDSI